MLDLVKIGQLITKLRIDYNMTQNELADKLYVTHQAVSKWEKGKSIPSIDIMYELTKLFQISIDELICTDNLPDDFPSLLKRFPRNYCINQLINGQFTKVKLESILYLLNKEERTIVLHHIIYQKINPNIPDLFPYLNLEERRMILDAIIRKKLKLPIDHLIHMLTESERKLIVKEYTNEY